MTTNKTDAHSAEHIAGVDHAHELLRRLGYHRDGDHFINANRRGAEAIHVSTISTIVYAGQLCATQPDPEDLAAAGVMLMGRRDERPADEPDAQGLPSEMAQRLFQLLNGAAGDGLIINEVDAAELFSDLFPDHMEFITRGALPDAAQAIAEARQQAEPATIEDNSQQWAGMDGATAWHLIDRHADGWGDVAKMMGEWLNAKTRPAAVPPHMTGLTQGISGAMYHVLTMIAGRARAFPSFPMGSCLPEVFDAAGMEMPPLHLCRAPAEHPR